MQQQIELPRFIEWILKSKTRATIFFFYLAIPSGAVWVEWIMALMGLVEATLTSMPELRH